MTFREEYLLKKLLTPSVLELVHSYVYADSYGSTIILSNKRIKHKGKIREILIDFVTCGSSKLVAMLELDLIIDEFFLQIGGELTSDQLFSIAHEFYNYIVDNMEYIESVIYKEIDQHTKNDA